MRQRFHYLTRLFLDEFWSFTKDLCLCVFNDVVIGHLDLFEFDLNDFLLGVFRASWEQTYAWFVFAIWSFLYAIRVLWHKRWINWQLAESPNRPNRVIPSDALTAMLFCLSRAVADHIENVCLSAFICCKWQGVTDYIIAFVVFDSLKTVNRMHRFWFKLELFKGWQVVCRLWYNSIPRSNLSFLHVRFLAILLQDVTHG